MKSDIISLSGFRGAGKDTLGLCLAQLDGYRVIKFATPIRDIVSYLYDVRRKSWEDSSFKNKPNPNFNNKPPRDYLIQLGTYCFRKLDKDIWVRLLGRELDSCVKSVITDTRFLNEFLMLKKAGAYIVFVERPGLLPRWIETLTNFLGVNEFTRVVVSLFNKNIGSPSEFYQLEIRKQADYILCNDGTIENLADKARQLLDTVKR